MEKILLVDDDAVLRDAVLGVLQLEGYSVRAVTNGREALESFEAFEPDLIISDISMPEVDGFDLLKAIRLMPKGVAVPFLFISARSAHEDTRSARLFGADDYLFKPFESEELLNAIRVRFDRRRAVMLFDTREAHLQTVMMLANVIEARDAYTRGHVERVREYALALAKEMGWPTERLAILEFGAIVHDIGKIIVPSAVLNKQMALTKKEQELMRQHVKAGAQMLKDITHLKMVIPYVLYHHERWDGSGYPFGLKDEDIPVEGRLLAVVDSYDAMTSDRSYRSRLSKEVALEEIRRMRAKQFDPDITDAFLRIASIEATGGIQAHGALSTY